jgi:3-oxoacyl-[acyl-carrier-protein] synthase III
MGTTIEAVAAATAGDGWRGSGSLRLTDEAALACLKRAGRQAGELDLLVNTGIYHDQNLGEPALAALIQEDIGANLGHPPVGGHGTFSFDVLNGSAGVVTAAYLIDGFMRSGAARLGMVVAADVDPGPSHTPGFDFSPAGGAMLLGWSDTRPGFTAFHLQTFPEYQDLFESSIAWQESKRRHLPFGATGRNALQVLERPAFRESSVDCAVAAVQRFAGRPGVDLAQTDLVVACHSSPDFADLLVDRLGLPRHLVAHPLDQFQRSHTARPLAALENAWRSDRLGAATQVLFVTAGAGISVALALYRQQA